MSTACPENAASIAAIEALETVVTNSTGHLDCVLVAHDNDLMIERVLDTLQNESIAVLRLNDDEWLSGLAAVVGRAANCGISLVVIAGDSESLNVSGTPSTQSQQTDNNSQDSKLTRMLHRLRQQEQRLDASKQLFADRMIQLQTHAELQTEMRAGDFRTHALFYIASGDRLVRFDTQSRTYRPLT